MARQILLMSALLLGVLSSAPATACDGCGGGGGAYGFGLGYMYGSLDYSVPYFAAHPPVYYSAPVPRTYGYSPFAYPPHFRTPELMEVVEPMSIVNPYVPSSDSAPEAEQTTQAKAVEPLVVMNPYVKSTNVMHASHSL
jgi:hypothetical protein